MKNQLNASSLFQFSACVALLVLLSASVANAQSDPVPYPADELDTFQGCSLGIRLELEDEQLIVSNVYEHVVESSPFEKHDRILKIGDLSFPGSALTELGELLDKTEPDTNMAVSVQRGEERLRLNVETFRKEFVDIQAIYRRLRNNRIIEKHLKETGREELMDEMADRMADSVRKSETPREAAEALNRILDEINVSHTAIIPASAGLAFSNRAKGSIGLVLQRHNINGRVGYFIVDKKPGSPSYFSALKLGDEILTINNVPIAQSRRLDLSGHEARHKLFSIDSDIDEEVSLGFARTPFDDPELVTLVTGKDPSTVNAMLASKKILESDKSNIGYLRFWNLMSMGISTQFSKILGEEFSNCDGLIMDLRGRGGIVPAVTSLNQTVAKLDKPVVVVIDGLTRSAKEMLAYLLKKHDHVLVVGMKTAGAVTGATIANLPSGNSLMFPVASADSLKQFVDGAIIEGIGVEPDEEVNDFVPYSAGEDRILKVALQRVTEMAKSSNQSGTQQVLTPTLGEK